jgi:hypothetical protein
MSRALELLNVYVEVHIPVFQYNNLDGNFYFCGNSMCDSCFVHKIRNGASCRITTEEYENLKVTNPEYMI